MAGYSKTPLIEKLAIKAGMKVAFLRMPPRVRAAIRPLPPKRKVSQEAGEGMDYVHYFAESIAELEGAFAALKASLNAGGMLWISWRKGKKRTNLTENDVRAIALRGGLVDVKVCAVDKTWSGLKLVYRVKDR